MRLLSLAPPFCGSLHAGGGRAGGREAGKEAGKEGWREGAAGGAGGEGHTCRRGGGGRSPGAPSRRPRRQLQDRCGRSWRRHPAPRPTPAPAGQMCPQLDRPQLCPQLEAAAPRADVPRRPPQSPPCGGGRGLPQARGSDPRSGAGGSAGLDGRSRCRGLVPRGGARRQQEQRLSPGCAPRTPPPPGSQHPAGNRSGSPGPNPGPVGACQGCEHSEGN